MLCRRYKHGQVAQAAGIAIRIADVDDGGAQGRLGFIGAAVADGGTCRQIPHLGYPGFQRHNGFQGPFRMGLAVRVKAIEHDPFPHHIQMGLWEAKDARTVAGMAGLGPPGP